MDVYCQLSPVLPPNLNHAVFLLRGNHEDESQNEVEWVGFFKVELQEKYNKNFDETDVNTLKTKFLELYGCLPVALYFGISGVWRDGLNWIQCCHGGVGANLIDSTMVEGLNNFLGNEAEKVLNIPVYDSETGNYFFWGDFKQRNVKICCEDRNNQGAYSWDDISEFLNGTKIKAIFRGHQHFGPGLKMFALEEIDCEEPISWEYVVRKNEMINGEFLLHNYFPVFTFTTATEFGLATEIFYGILKTKPNFNGWTFKPVVVESLVKPKLLPPSSVTRRPLPVPPSSGAKKHSKEVTTVVVPTI